MAEDNEDGIKDVETLGIEILPVWRFKRTSSRNIKPNDWEFGIGMLFNVLRDLIVTCGRYIFVTVFETMKTIDQR